MSSCSNHCVDCLPLRADGVPRVSILGLRQRISLGSFANSETFCVATKGWLIADDMAISTLSKNYEKVLWNFTTDYIQSTRMNACANRLIKCGLFESRCSVLIEKRRPQLQHCIRRPIISTFNFALDSFQPQLNCYEC